MCRAATQLGIETMFPENKPKFEDFLESYRPSNRLIIVRNPWARLVSAYEDKIVASAWDLKVGRMISETINKHNS